MKSSQTKTLDGGEANDVKEDGGCVSFKIAPEKESESDKAPLSNTSQ